MLVDDFDFDLPQDRIALTPASPRDHARLLHVARETIGDKTVRDLPDILRPGDLLVVNDTKVIPAQLTGTRAGREGGSAVVIEATLHKRLASTANGKTCWRSFLRPAKRAGVGDQISFGDGFAAVVLQRDGGDAVLEFFLGSDEFDQQLARHGAMPLPPYIARKREINSEDTERYQTVYAAEEGSVAAPTAGLHFTPELLTRLRDKEIGIETITLHVGAGTFLPVTVDNVSDHKMHSEWGEITEPQARRINDARKAGGRIVAVGTTSMRLLESAARDDGSIAPFCAETAIFITPGYRFKSVDLMMTNFHLPRSTLFMLVCAFAGTEAMKRAYAHAIENEYRFYSYGDACFLERKE